MQVNPPKENKQSSLFNLPADWEVEWSDMPDYDNWDEACLLYTSPSPRDLAQSRMPSSA